MGVTASGTQGAANDDFHSGASVTALKLRSALQGGCSHFLCPAAPSDQHRCSYDFNYIAATLVRAQRLGEKSIAVRGPLWSLHNEPPQTAAGPASVLSILILMKKHSSLPLS